MNLIYQSSNIHLKAFGAAVLPGLSRLHERLFPPPDEVDQVLAVGVVVYRPADAPHVLRPNPSVAPGNLL